MLKWIRSKEWDKTNERDIMVYTCDLGKVRFMVRNLGKYGAVLTVQTVVATQLSSGAWVDMWCNKPSMKKVFDSVRSAKEEAESILVKMTTVYRRI